MGQGFLGSVVYYGFAATEFLVDGLDVDSGSVNKKWNFVMTALAVEVFFVGMTCMVAGNDKNGVVEPRFG